MTLNKQSNGRRAVTVAPPPSERRGVRPRAVVRECWRNSSACFCRTRSLRRPLARVDAFSAARAARWQPLRRAPGYNRCSQTSTRTPLETAENRNMLTKYQIRYARHITPPTLSLPCEIAATVLPPGGWYEVLSMQLTKTISLFEIRIYFFVKNMSLYPQFSILISDTIGLKQLLRQRYIRYEAQ